MPRKQRFKPSRKPKPAPQSEAPTIGHETRAVASNVAAHNDNAGSGPGASRMSDESSLASETDQHSS